MYSKKDKKHICQGDIFQDFPHKQWIKPITLPFFVVLTQACDLEQDFNNRNDNKRITDDKQIQSVLVCPAYISAEFKKGEHLSKVFGLNMEPHREQTRWNIIIQNNNPRYHCLKKDIEFGIPELIIDFKHYYTIPMEVLHKQEEKYLCSLQDLFREDLSQRFASYLSRIGLP